MTPGPGVEPGPHWWEASALTYPEKAKYKRGKSARTIVKQLSSKGLAQWFYSNSVAMHEQKRMVTFQTSKETTVD